MPRSSAYLFLELAIVAYMLGFCWEHWSSRDLFSQDFWRPALLLAGFWFAIDQVAVGLGLWSFPDGGTLRFRIFALPLEEGLLFFLHTFMCWLLVKQYSRSAA
jgi:lycopene cyclase domain-containing protein